MLALKAAVCTVIWLLIQWRRRYDGQYDEWMVSNWALARMVALALGSFVFLWLAVVFATMYAVRALVT